MSESKESFRQRIKRRAIVLEIGGFRPPDDPQTSWFGKVGWGLPGEAWPRVEDRPMWPLAQINLTELPFRPPRLEDVAFLTVFIDPELSGAADGSEASLYCVRAYANPGELVPLLPPPELASELKPLPMRPTIVEEDFPCRDDLAGEIPEALEDSYDDLFENRPGFKLGGWPTLIQSEISWAPWDEHPATPEFVFQIDSTEKGRWNWSDGGVGYFGRGTRPGYEKEWVMVWQSC